ncbi:MAG: AMP-binding protein, partial [Pseudomonadota bacterium]
MQNFGTLEDKTVIEAVPYADRMDVATPYQALSRTAAQHGARPAITFQIKSGPTDKAETLDWKSLHAQVTQMANVLRAEGVGEGDTVAYMLPNCNETAVTLLAGATAGIVNPINPLLEPEQIGALLAETGAKVLVTLAPFPKTDVA